MWVISVFFYATAKSKHSPIKRKFENFENSKNGKKLKFAHSGHPGGAPPALIT
jgi:hypothetical protein